jgi:hypothetical protein
MNSPANAGKLMNYYLMDGIPNGRVECTLGTRIGVACQAVQQASNKLQQFVVKTGQ